MRAVAASTAGSAVSTGRRGCCSITVRVITRPGPVRASGRSGASWPQPAGIDAVQAKANRSFRTGSRLLAPRNRIQLEAVPDQFVTEFIGDALLQAFDLLIAKLDHATRLQIDEMVVMCTRHFLVAGAAIAEVVPGDDVCLLKQ